MKYYDFTARDAEGKRVHGRMEAEDENQLHNQLKESGRYLESFREREKGKVGRRMRTDRLAEFCGNIGHMVGAGVTLPRALRVLEEDASAEARERRLYGKILTEVRSGKTFSDACAAQQGIFPPMMINMIESAEDSGRMKDTLEQLSIQYEKEYRLNQKVKNAMLYPKILLVVLFLVLVVILGFVVPRFDDLFARMDHLPWLTTALLAVSDFVHHQWPFLIILLVAVAVLYMAIKEWEPVRRQMDRLRLHLPFVGKRLQLVYSARVARTISGLYKAGVSITKSLAVAADTVDNRYIAAQFERVIADVRSGVPVSEALAQVDGLTGKLLSALKVGEETGSFEDCLDAATERMEEDAENAINRMVSVIEPAMIVVMAVIVGAVMLAVLLPIYGSYGSIMNR